LTTLLGTTFDTPVQAACVYAMSDTSKLYLFSALHTGSQTSAKRHPTNSQSKGQPSKDGILDSLLPVTMLSLVSIRWTDGGATRRCGVMCVNSSSQDGRIFRVTYVQTA